MIKNYESRMMKTKFITTKTSDRDGVWEFQEKRRDLWDKEGRDRAPENK